MSRIKIIGSGSYIPDKILTNDDLAQFLDTSDEWIFSRTGIKSRHIAQETNASMGVKALNKALQRANLTGTDIDGIILATSTPDRIFPATAITIQKELNIKGFAFDMQAVCAGFMFALYVGEKMLRSHEVKRLAIIGSDIFSKIVDWTDRSTAVLFGDGAGAVILEVNDDSSDIIDIQIQSQPHLEDILYVEGGQAFGPVPDNQPIDIKTGKIVMDGPKLFKHAIDGMYHMTTEMLKKHNITTIDWLVAHQANLRILNTLGHKLNIDDDKIMLSIEEYANTSAATIPITLDKYWDKIKRNDLMLLTAAGAGMTFGSCLLRF
jgi:3-oxoacyl-[acyl-carrier-protein] synthase-3